MRQALLLAVVVSLLAIGGAAAAERQVRAAPADKKCSIYGAGFRYVPGADLCMKIGGWVRAQAGGDSGHVNWGALNANPSDRGTGSASAGARGYVTTDVRKQTGYGTVRAYLSVGAHE